MVVFSVLIRCSHCDHHDIFYGRDPRTTRQAKIEAMTAAAAAGWWIDYDPAAHACPACLAEHLPHQPVFS